MKKRTKKLLSVLALLSGQGCALQSAPEPASVRDTYLVAHGMASSYARRPDADPAVVQQLAILDERAAIAVQGQDNAAMANTVAALTSFAARQTSSEVQGR